MPESKLSASLVVYNSDPVLTQKAISSVLNTNLLYQLEIVDNSADANQKGLFLDPRLKYSCLPDNPGFGTSHNTAINNIKGVSKYHLIINPDVYFDQGTLEELVTYMDSHPEIGVIMPKVLYPDGRHQYLAKLLPSPFDFIIRRFLPIAKVQAHINHGFELRGAKDSQILDVPFLSGCCLLFRTEALEKVNGFDEKIFMYTEDIDICRRILNAGYRSVYYPGKHVYHDHVRKSLRNLPVLWVYLKSGIYYFNKWGWLFDKQRVIVNKQALSQLNKT